jgi:hypothetical protein
LAWFSTEANASARLSTQGFLRNLVEMIGNGSVELPSSQNILQVIIAPQGGARNVKKCNEPKTFVPTSTLDLILL